MRSSEIPNVRAATSRGECYNAAAGHYGPVLDEPWPLKKWFLDPNPSYHDPGWIKQLCQPRPRRQTCFQRMINNKKIIKKNKKNFKKKNLVARRSRASAIDRMYLEEMKENEKHKLDCNHSRCNGGGVSSDWALVFV